MEHLGPVFFGLAALLFVSIVVPRVNARLKGSRTGWEQLFDSPTGQVFMGVVAIALIGAIAVATLTQ
jgi:hypothetical protein